MHTLVLLTVVLSSVSPEAAPASLQATAAPALYVPSQLRLTSAMDSQAPRDHGRRLLHDAVVARVVLESLGGLGMGGGGNVLGSAVMLGAGVDSPVAALLPMSLLVLGSSLGVSLVGSEMDGGGRFSSALLGSTIGFVAPLAIGTVLLASTGCSASSIRSCDGFMPLAMSLLVLPTVGAIIGYEASSPQMWPPQQDEPWLTSRSSSPRLVPTLAPARQGLGATLGLAGTL